MNLMVVVLTLVFFTVALLITYVVLKGIVHKVEQRNQLIEKRQEEKINKINEKSQLKQTPVVAAEVILSPYELEAKADYELEKQGPATDKQRAILTELGITAPKKLSAEAAYDMIYCSTPDQQQLDALEFFQEPVHGTVGYLKMIERADELLTNEDNARQFDYARKPDAVQQEYFRFFAVPESDVESIKNAHDAGLFIREHGAKQEGVKAFESYWATGELDEQTAQQYPLLQWAMYQGVLFYFTSPVLLKLVLGIRVPDLSQVVDVLTELVASKVISFTDLNTQSEVDEIYLFKKVTAALIKHEPSLLISE